MSEYKYIHHIPGRLRLELAQIRRDSGRTQEVQAAVSRISGVTSANANSVTGSLLIHCNTSQVDARAIVHAMTTNGLLPARMKAEKAPVQPALSPLVDKILNVLAGKLIERSAVALIGALL